MYLEMLKVFCQERGKYSGTIKIFLTIYSSIKLNLFDIKWNCTYYTSLYRDQEYFFIEWPKILLSFIILVL